MLNSLTQIATTYHLEQGRIFNAFEEFHKPPSDRKINIAEYYDYYDPNPLSKAREPHEIFARYELALKAEANCIQAVKVADREVREYLLVCKGGGGEFCARRLYLDT